MIWTGAESDLDQVTSTAPRPSAGGAFGRGCAPRRGARRARPGDVPGILPDPGAPPRADAVVAGS